MKSEIFFAADPVCPACRRLPDGNVWKVSDENLHTAGEYSIHWCRNCGIGITSPVPNSFESVYPREYFTPAPESIVAFKKLALSLTEKYGRGRVLDAGCHSGDFLFAMSESGWSVEGIEVSHEAAGLAEARGIIVHRGSISEIELPDDQYDLITGLQVIEHLAEPVEALRKLYRALKPGGVLICSIPNAASPEARLLRARWFHLDIPRHLYHFPASTFRTILAGTGFRVQTIVHGISPHTEAGAGSAFDRLTGGVPGNFLSWKVRGAAVRIYTALVRLSRSAPVVEFHAFKTALSPLPLSIVIVTWNGWHHLEQCLSALFPTLPSGTEVIVIDNASTDETEMRLTSDFPWVRYVRLDENKGLPGGLNEGIRLAKGQFILELNNDTIPLSGWLEPLLERAKSEPNLGIVAGTKRSPDGSIQDAGGFFERLPRRYSRPNPSPNLPCDVDHVGTGFLMKKVMIDEIGFFDEFFNPGYFEDLDFCRRAARAGWRVAHEPASEIIHLGRSTSTALLGESGLWRQHDRNRILYYLLNSRGSEFLGKIVWETFYCLRLLLGGHFTHLKTIVRPLLFAWRPILRGRRRRG